MEYEEGAKIKLRTVMVIAFMLCIAIGNVTALTVVSDHQNELYDGYRYAGNDIGIVSGMNTIPPGVGVGQNIHINNTPQGAIVSLHEKEVDFLVFP